MVCFHIQDVFLAFFLFKIMILYIYKIQNNDTKNLHISKQVTVMEHKIPTNEIINSGV